MTDPLGNTTTYTYDDQRQQATESLSGDTSIPALTRTTVYDEYGNVTSETEAWGVSSARPHTHTMRYTARSQSPIQRCRNDN